MIFSFFTSRFSPPFTTGIFFGLIAFASFSLEKIHSEIVAEDPFTYSTGANADGASGGSGWASNWTSLSGVKFSSSGIVFAGSNANGNELAYRSFAEQSGDTLYIAFTVTATGHEGNDAFMLWLDASDNLGSNATHSGSRLNAGMLSGLLFARPTTSKSDDLTGGNVEDGESYRIVVAYAKSKPGRTEPFNTVELWVNPSQESQETSIGRVVSVGGIPAVTTIGFRGFGNEAADHYLVQDLVIATDWKEVFAP